MDETDFDYLWDWAADKFGDWLPILAMLAAAALGWLAHVIAN